MKVIVKLKSEGHHNIEAVDRIFDVSSRKKARTNIENTLKVINAYRKKIYGDEIADKVIVGIYFPIKKKVSRRVKAIRKK